MNDRVELIKNELENFLKLIQKSKTRITSKESKTKAETIFTLWKDSKYDIELSFRPRDLETISTSLEKIYNETIFGNGRKSIILKGIKIALKIITISRMTNVENEIVYSKGYSYDFYRDIKIILQSAQKEVLIIDSYVNTELFDIYVEKIKKNIIIKILTNPRNPEKNAFYLVAKKFALKSKGKFEVKESRDCHDRVVFIDSDAWIFGQSLKDAGKKPTYLIKVHKVKDIQSIFDPIWREARKIV